VIPGVVEVVAITSTLLNPLPDDYVLLPWHAQKHPRTGLNRKSAAVCSWITSISTDDIKNMVGTVPASTFATIAAKIQGNASP
jgi:mRNA-degrading endonuclease toxin of MazEF toxin-antitoxin module